MKRIIMIGIFSLVACLALGQTTKEEMFSKLEKTGGVYYAYPTDFAPQTPAPKGYHPFYISHYGRHGSRYLLGDGDYKSTLDIMQKAHKAGVLTALGEDVLRRLVIVWAEAEFHGDELSPVGVAQHKGIAERMFKSFPEVFTNGRHISARSTTSMRCALSMIAFCEQLKDMNPKLDIYHETSRKYMSYLNYHTPEQCEFNGEKGPWRPQYNKFNESHTNPDRLMKALFSSDEYVVKNINPQQLMWSFYWITSDLQDMLTDIRLYDMWEPQELFDLWQVFNYHFYVCDANSKINDGLAMESVKPLLRNVIESAQKAIADNGQAATLRFGHDGNVIPLAAALHLDGCDASIDVPEDFYKVWCDFKVAPMAGNIQLVFFRNEKSGDILVKFLLNENEKTIPISSDCHPYYHWKDVEKYYLDILDAK